MQLNVPMVTSGLLVVHQAMKVVLSSVMTKDGGLSVLVLRGIQLMLKLCAVS